MVGHCLLLYFLMLKINVKFLFSHLDLVTLMATGQHVLYRFRIGLHHFQFEKRRAEKEAKFSSVGSNAAYSFGGGGGGVGNCLILAFRTVITILDLEFTLT